MENPTHLPGRGKEISFYNIDGGCILVQEGKYKPENYLIKDGRPLTPKEAFQYIKKRAGYSIKDTLSTKLMWLSSDYPFNEITMHEDLAERLRGKDDLKECFAQGKMYSNYGGSKIISLGWIFDIKELSEPSNEDHIGDHEYQTGITFEKAREIAKKRSAEYAQFLEGLEKIKAGKI
jgi:hypothetical protein